MNLYSLDLNAVSRTLIIVHSEYHTPCTRYLTHRYLDDTEYTMVGQEVVKQLAADRERAEKEAAQNKYMATMLEHYEDHADGKRTIK